MKKYPCNGKTALELHRARGGGGRGGGSLIDYLIMTTNAQTLMVNNAVKLTGT